MVVATETTASVVVATEVAGSVAAATEVAASVPAETSATAMASTAADLLLCSILDPKVESFGLALSS